MSLSVVTTPADLMHCGNEMSCTIHTDLALSTPNLKITIAVLTEQVYGSGTYAVLTTQTLDPDSNGDCQFFINQFLWDCFENAIDLPTIGSDTEYQLVNHIRKYRLMATELSGSPQAPSDYITTGLLAQTRYAVHGGIPEHWNRSRPYFGAGGWNVALGKRFLDYRGSNPRTRIDEDQWLNWMWQDIGDVFGGIAVDYMVKWYRSDGTTGESVFLTTSVINKNEAYAFPAGFTQLDLATNETATEKITKYQTWVQILYLGDPFLLSEIKTWKVDRAYYEILTKIHYRNSLGTIEQFTFRGSGSLNHDIDKGEAKQYTDNSFALSAGSSVIVDINVENGFTLITDALTADEAKQVLDIKASRLCLLQGDDEYLPMRVIANKHNWQLTQNVQQYEVQFIIDYDNQFPDLFL